MGGSNEGSTGEQTRRSVLKSGAVISAVSGIGGLGTVAARPGEGKGKAKVQSLANQPPILAPKIHIGPELKQFDWVTLIGSERESMAKAHLRHIDNASVSDRTKQNAREALKELWSSVSIRTEHKRWGDIERDPRFKPMSPEERSEDDPASALNVGRGKRTTTVYSLESDPADVRELTRATEQELRQASDVSISTAITEPEFLPTLSSIVDSGVSVPGQDGDVGAQWSQYDGHDIISYWAGDDGPQGETHVEIIKNKSPVPDDRDYEFPDSVTPEVMEVLFGGWPDQVTHSYAHAYNPDPNTDAFGLSYLPEAGHADHWFSDKMNDALAESVYSNSRYEQVGYALHYLEDLGNPMHTGAFLEQANNPSVHTKYEDSLSNRMELDHDPHCGRYWNPCTVKDKLMKVIRNYETPKVAQGHLNWIDAARVLATISHNYSEDVVTFTSESGENPLVECEALFEDTRELLKETKAYSLGALYQIYSEQ